MIIHTKYKDVRTGETYVDNVFGVEQERLTTSPLNSHCWTVRFHADSVNSNDEKDYRAVYRPRS